MISRDAGGADLSRLGTAALANACRYAVVTQIGLNQNTAAGGTGAELLASHGAHQGSDDQGSMRPFLDQQVPGLSVFEADPLIGGAWLPARCEEIENRARCCSGRG